MRLSDNILRANCMRFLNGLSKVGIEVVSDAKVISTVGSNAFTTDRSSTWFVSWFSNQKDGLDTPFGVALAITAGVSAGVTTTVTRYFNMKRKEEKAGHDT